MFESWASAMARLMEVSVLPSPGVGTRHRERMPLIGLRVGATAECAGSYKLAARPDRSPQRRMLFSSSTARSSVTG